METNNKNLTTFAITVGAAAFLCALTQGAQGFMAQIIGWPVFLGFFGTIAGLIGLAGGHKFITSFATTAKVLSYIIWVLAGLGFFIGVVAGIGAFV